MESCCGNRRPCGCLRPLYDVCRRTSLRIASGTKLFETPASPQPFRRFHTLHRTRPKSKSSVPLATHTQCIERFPSRLLRHGEIGNQQFKWITRQNRFRQQLHWRGSDWQKPKRDPLSAAHTLLGYCSPTRLSPVCGIIVVVSKGKEVEQRLVRTEHQLRLLQKISRHMVRDIGLQEALDSVVALVVEFMECDSCLLYLLDKGQLVLRASNSPDTDVVGRVKLAMSEGLTGWVAREKRLLSISREAYLDPRFKFFSDLPEDTYEAFLSAPVISRRGIEGVINVQHRNPHPHSGIEMELLTTVGEQIGCLLMLATKADAPDLVLSSGPQRTSDRS
jgi:hypothetical protein